jgi:lysophospholipid acyltransferase (LPLAT)-like uncharacterized protein
MRTALGFLLGLFVYLWTRTLRIRVAGGAEVPAGARCVFGFWHGQQMLLVALARARRLVTLVSWSSDGQLQAGVMRALGVSTVRGSASRGGAAGLRGVVRAIRAGSQAAFAADGPRGPLHRAKPGAARAARLAKVPLVALGAAARPSIALGKAWDRFELPLPFARVVVVVSEPIADVSAAGASERLTWAIGDSERRARELLADGRRWTSREIDDMVDATR